MFVHVTGSRQEVWIWDAQTYESREEYEGTGDVVAVARGDAQHHLRMLVRNQETVVELSAGGRRIAWFCEPLEKITTHSNGRVWAGRVANGLQILLLEEKPSAHDYVDSI